MKTKKFAVLVVAIVFFLVVLFSCIALFAVKKVEINFAVGDDTQITEVQAELEKFVGKSLVFLKEEEIAESICAYHYMELVSIKKDYPNVVKVEIKERVEVYEIVSGETVYVTTENGLVLRSYNLLDQEQSRDKIRLILNGVVVEDASLGQVISTDGDELLAKVFEMAKSVELTNCIQSIELTKATEKEMATFNTHTGVKIIINKILDDGVEKIKTAFKKYDEGTTDYQKTFNYIVAVKLAETGEIEVKWTETID